MGEDLVDRVLLSELSSALDAIGKARERQSQIVGTAIVMTGALVAFFSSGLLTPAVISSGVEAGKTLAWLRSIVRPDAGWASFLALVSWLFAGVSSLYARSVSDEISISAYVLRILRARIREGREGTGIAGTLLLPVGQYYQRMGITTAVSLIGGSLTFIPGVVLCGMATGSYMEVLESAPWYAHLLVHATSAVWLVVLLHGIMLPFRRRRLLADFLG